MRNNLFVGNGSGGKDLEGSMP